VRIAVLYNRDIYALKALNLLLPALAEHQVGLFYSDRVGRPPVDQPATLARLAQVERELFETLQSGGARFLGSQQLATKYGCTDVSINDVNETAGLERLQQFGPDLAVSIRFGKILKPAAIAIPKQGVINLHSGLLPAYRGVMPTFWAMLRGDETIGATLHWVPDATIDTGPAIAKAEQTRASGMSYLSEVWRLYEVGVPLIAAAVARIAKGDLTLSSTPPAAPNSESNYFTFPDAAAIEQFEREGLQLCDAADANRITEQLAYVT
jgi:methionyl-tRNA formyltransferase